VPVGPVALRVLLTGCRARSGLWWGGREARASMNILDGGEGGAAGEGDPSRALPAPGLCSVVSVSPPRSSTPAP
jgi:hypothetical protein